MTGSARSESVVVTVGVAVGDGSGVGVGVTCWMWIVDDDPLDGCETTVSLRTPTVGVAVGASGCTADGGAGVFVGDDEDAVVAEDAPCAGAAGTPQADNSNVRMSDQSVARVMQDILRLVIQMAPWKRPAIGRIRLRIPSRSAGAVSGRGSN